MMGEATLYSNFYVGLSIAFAIVLAAATLLLLVWTTARRILRLATTVLGLVTQIKENTKSIWELQKTNQVAIGISEGAAAIESHAALVAKALHENNQENNK